MRKLQERSKGRLHYPINWNTPRTYARERYGEGRLDGNDTICDYTSGGPGQQAERHGSGIRRKTHDNHDYGTGLHSLLFISSGLLCMSTGVILLFQGRERMGP
ncbi:hypothetical protein SODALDRAFT_55655 [Sodiomyces alkalinus F11]|uniref:Uncharacterized protein n=1 Tax=Sodiomyces alkalinus (strain CBS 110278 / VKM F-3762 / F11) TaxID=1314773 RepID=A0A3N2PNB8_SODAK|nr:hypothetical protein SODALDRAFT_55655 [Sodiomyces alkalinus F11]ROT35983.1 hypothetical protein SODALDRAFT_55655 [Sodiomyces alkalinus F11]